MDDTTALAALADWIAGEHRAAGARVYGLNGAQGCGKSTLAARLAARLRDVHALRAVVLALDDLYLPRAARLRLAADVHPLLATRGVPGTHDVALGQALLARLRALPGDASLAIPRFSKAADDRLPPGQWHAVGGPVDVVLFEGWCVATPPQTEAELATPVNELEASEDPDGRWRRWVNTQLAGPYRPLFAAVQRLLFLAAPDFGCVLEWRLEQEHRDNLDSGGVRRPPMDRPAVRRFIAHYERLTRHALAALPASADAVLRLTPRRGARALHFRDRNP